MESRVIFIALCMGLPLSATTLSTERSDSGIHGPRYSELLKKFSGWNTNYPTITEVIDYGKSVEG